MSIRETAKLACKFLSVYILAFAVISIPNVFMNFASTNLSDPKMKGYLLVNAIAYVGNLLLKLCFGVLLWLRSDKLSIRLAGNGEIETQGQPQMDSKSYLAVGVGVIGTYLAAFGLVRTISTYIKYGFQASYWVNRSGTKMLPPDQLRDIIQLAIGLILLAGVYWFSRMKTTSLDSENQDEKEADQV